MWKGSGPISSAGWKNIFSIAVEIIPFTIRKRARRFLNSLKSWRVGVDLCKFRISIFWNCKPPSFRIHVYSLVITRARVFLIGHLVFNEITGLRSHGEAFRHSCFDLVFILYKERNTCPGAGTLCNWGTRYDLSGDSSLLSPKLFPLFLFYSKIDLMLYLVAPGLAVRSLVKSDFFP